MDVSILARTGVRALLPSPSIAAEMRVFQSSLAPECERYSDKFVTCQYRQCFNPRSHRSASATQRANQRQQFHGVSILARTGVRALLRSEFVRRRGASVSILARTGVRALLPRCNIAGRRHMFQSSLAPECERYGCRGDGSHGRSGFNPRSHRSASATWDSLVPPVRDHVSILARTGVRALRSRPRSIMAGIVFQSSLAPECERYLERLIVETSHYAFQSSLAPECERYTAQQSC